MNFNLFWIVILIMLPTLSFNQERTAIKQAPSRESVTKLNSVKHEIETDFDNAIKEYEKLIKKYPEKKDLLYNLGNLNYRNGDLESAKENYRNSIMDVYPQKEAYALYNMGNIYYDQGEYQKSVELFKQALQLSPADDDIRHNYELSKLMLKQNPPQQNNENNDGSKERNDKDEQSKNEESPTTTKENKQLSSDEKNKEKNHDSEINESESSEKESNENKQEQFKSNDDEINNDDQKKNPSKIESQYEKEKQLGRKEAESILNALKANESNLKQKKYKAIKGAKLEKDW